MISGQGQGGEVGTSDRFVAPPDGVTVHIKSMGAGTWSDRLHKAALEKHAEHPVPLELQPMIMRIEGPYGHMGVKLAKYSHILNISGGIGFTPCAGLLQMVLDAPRRHACLPCLRSMRLVWVVRTHAQLSWFEALVAKALSLRESSDFRLSVDLYVTKGPGPLQSNSGSLLLNPLPLPTIYILIYFSSLFHAATALVTVSRKLLVGAPATLLSLFPHTYHCFLASVYHAITEPSPAPTPGLHPSHPSLPAGNAAPGRGFQQTKVGLIGQRSWMRWQPTATRNQWLCSSVARPLLRMKPVFFFSISPIEQGVGGAECDRVNLNSDFTY